MGHFLGADVWRVIRSESAIPGKKRLAVAFVYNVDSLSLRSGDTLIADASERAIATGQTSGKLVHQLVKKGVRVYSKAGLHAKIYILPNSLIVASANLSAKSTSLVEAGIIERSPQARRDAVDWFNKTLKDADLLSVSAASSLARISVVRRGGGLVAPTLLEALDAGHNVLNDYVFSYCFTDSEIPERLAAKNAHSSGLIPPGTSPKYWTWSEWVEERGLKGTLEATYSGRPGICFYVQQKKDGTSFVFSGVENYATTFVGSRRIRYGGRTLRVAYDLIQKGIPGLSTKGKPWRRSLIQRLNEGLLRESSIARQLEARLSAEIKLSELIAIASARRK